AGIDCRHDRAEAKSAIGPGGDMTTISEAGVIVLTLVVRMPEINHGAAKRTAASRQDKSGKFERPAASAGLVKVAALRRFRLEERSLTLTDCRFIAIVTGGGRGSSFATAHSATARPRPC